MRTKELPILFSISDVLEFVTIMDDRNPIYKSIANAKAYGHENIPLPPTMPMIAYKWIQIPWKMKDPIIHRTQSCVHHKMMYTDVPYLAHVSLSEQKLRNHYSLVNQTLQITDSNGNICFEGISQLMVGDTLANY
jgi:hypothetical protein